MNGVNHADAAAGLAATSPTFFHFFESWLTLGFALVV
jgi:hypothetical protein